MTPVVRIVNKTVWPTAMLRPFVRRIAREEFPATSARNTRRSLTLTIRYTRGWGSCSGYAYYNSSSAVVRVPHPKHWPFPVLDFCHVVGHEFAHCRGMKHRQMGLHYQRGAYSDAHYAWAKALPVPVLVKKPKPSVADKRAARLKAAEAAIARWTRKRKLADTKLKLWTRRARALHKLARTISVESVSVAPLSPPVVESVQG